jgi:hypothetical protein
MARRIVVPRSFDEFSWIARTRAFDRIILRYDREFFTSPVECYAQCLKRKDVSQFIKDLANAVEVHNGAHRPRGRRLGVGMFAAAWFSCMYFEPDSWPAHMVFVEHRHGVSFCSHSAWSRGPVDVVASVNVAADMANVRASLRSAPLWALHLGPKKLRIARSSRGLMSSGAGGGRGGCCLKREGDGSPPSSSTR